MCARYTLKSTADVLQQEFELPELPELPPRYNIAPTQAVLAIRESDAGVREATFLHWGLIPSWAKDPGIGTKLINARSETLLEKPSYRVAFKRRRCLIPADGFFEWHEESEFPETDLFGEVTKSGKTYKQPMWFHRKDERPFAFAGLWEYWETAEGGPIESCTIITTTANELLAQYHDRMPVILHREDYSAWLRKSDENANGLVSLLAPFPAEEMTAYDVTRKMSNPRYDFEDCIEPLSA